MEYHQDRFEDYSLMIYKQDELLALLPANKVENTVISHQGLTFGGLLLSKEVKFDDILEAFKALLKYLDLDKILELQLKLIPKIYHKLPSDEIDYLLFKVKAKLFRSDLTTTIDNKSPILINSSNRKRGLKKAIKNEIRVVETHDFESYWNEILIPNLEQRHNVLPTHSLTEIMELKQNFPNSIRQFNAFQNDKIVAGVTIFESENVAHAQYISANENMQELGSLDLIFDCLINDVFKNKAYFNFGISNENQGQFINSGLLSWKESFGGRPIVHQHFKIDVNNHYLLNEIML